MIRCNHCGKLAPAGATSCQNCGRPLVNMSSGMRGQSEQQELPAWLESLRANERPIANSKGDQPFSPSELVDENAMPSWMNLDQSRFESSDAFPAVSEQGGSGSEKQAFPTNNFEASSLIDEQSLPSWMRGQEALGQGMSASSLLQPESLPAWMKNLEAGGSPPVSQKQEQYGLPAQIPTAPPPSIGMPPVTGMPRTPATPLSTPTPPTFNTELGQGFAARELVDQQSLPGWMAGGQGPGPLPQNRPVPQGSGFAAGELLDQQSLPAWLKNQQEQSKSEPVSAMGVPVSGSGQGTGIGQQAPGSVGMPATNLLDESSLPNWMREGEQSTGSRQGMQSSGGLAAGSLLDTNALPSWLRNAEAPAQNVAQNQNIRNAQPPVRPVPSRPRGEGSVQEQSEAAANVFASMLGVAAPSPTMQGQQQQPPTNLGVPLAPPAQPVQPVSQVVPGWQSPVQPQTPMGYSAPTPLSPPPSSLPGSPYGTGETPVSPNLTKMTAPPSSYPGMGANYAGIGNSGETQSEGTKKKGFFDSIRDFFFK